MAQGRILIIILATLIVGFAGGFVLRPVLLPVDRAAAGSETAVPATAAAAGPRGKPYFAAHLDEARQVMTQCADGSVRGDECFNADMAIIEADGRARHKRFFGN